MRFNIFPVIAVLIGCHQLGNARLITKPIDTVAKINDSVFFNCSTTNAVTNLRWHHINQKEHVVYSGGQIDKLYRERFRVEKNMSTGSFDLVISPVMKDDVGEYRCEEGGFEADKHSAYLILVVDGPTCRSNFKVTTVIGEHACVTEPDSLFLSCDVSYLGKQAPYIAWMKDGQNLTTSETAPSGTNITSIVKMRNDQSLNKSSSYTCQIFQSIDMQLNCKLDAIKVDPWNISTLERTIGDEINCSLIYPCNYTWKLFEEDNLSTARVYKDPNLTFNIPGLYVCEAVCTILACTIKVMNVRVSTYAESKTGSITLLLLLLLAIPLVVLIIFVKCRRKQNGNELEMQPPKAAKNDHNNERTENEYASNSNQQIAMNHNDESDGTAKIEETAEETDAWKVKLRHHEEFLRDHMSTDFGLLDKLYESEFISNEEKQKITARQTAFERNRELLNTVIDSEKYEGLIEALKTSDQEHLANYLNADGNYSAEYGKVWPLTKKERLTLKHNHGMLIDLLEITDLLGRLYANEVIKKRQRDFILSKPTLHEKNEAFLDILRVCSLKSYQETIKCLCESDQTKLVEILKSGAVSARIDANIKGEEAADTEMRISTKINNLLCNTSLFESDIILQELLQLNLFTTSPRQNIALYFKCSLISEVDQLQEMTTNGRLNVIIETVFNRVITASAMIQVQLKCALEDFQKYRQYIEERLDSENSTEEDQLLEIPASIEALQGNTLHEKPTTDKFSFASRLQLKQRGVVMGVTKLKKKIYVLISLSYPWRHARTVLLVYDDQNPFTFLNRIEMKAIKDPRDVASSAANSIIYILESSESNDGKKRIRIWMIKEDGDIDQQVESFRWLAAKKYFNENVTLSVTKAGYPMMISQETNHPPYCLIIYQTPETNVSIPLPNEIQEPQHAVETSKGNFIILHAILREKNSGSKSKGGKRQMQDRIWVVSEVSGDGKTLVRRFLAKSEEEELECPLYLSIDSLDRVFVVDSMNNRVILFDSNLQWNRILIPDEDDGKEKNFAISCPKRLFYDEKIKQIIVGGGMQIQNEGVVVYVVNQK